MRLLNVASALAWCAAILPAQTFHVPAGTAGVEANSSSSYPWNRRTSDIRVQYIYDTTHLTSQGINMPIRISRLRWRANATTSSWTGGTYGNVIIHVNEAGVDYTAPSTTFATNHLGGTVPATPAYQGPVTVIAGSGNGSGVPAPYYVDVTLTNPVLYDPTSNNDLIIDIASDGSAWVGNGGTETTTLDVAYQTTAVPPPVASRVYNIGAGGHLAATGTTQAAVAAVVEITYAPAMGLFANFSAAPTTGSTPLSVNFTDQSFTSDPGGITSWAWDLDGDGMIDSNMQNPTFVYNNCGSFNVSLTVTDASNPPSTLTRNNFIVTDPHPGTSFTADRVCGASPLVVFFTDTTPGATAWAWDFNGDGMPDATTQTAAWVFTTGVHSVSLTTTVVCNQDTLTRANMIEVFDATANFRSADILEYQFNEVRGTNVFNSASTTAASSTGTVNTSGWQADPGRSGFRGAAGGALGNSGGASNTNLVSTGWPMNVNGDMTVSWWHRMAAAPGTSLAYTWGGPGASVRCFTGGVAGNGLYYRGSSIGDVTTGPMNVQAAPGTWEHIALVIDDNAGQAHWYFNGVLDSTTNFTPGTHSATNTDFHIGWHTSTTSTYSSYYDMDDFRLYCRALSPMEVLAVATAAENPTASLYGTGCSGPNVVPDIGASSAPVLGNNLSVFLQNAEAGRISALVMGADPAAPGIPFDLTPFLGAGCQLETDWLVALFHVTSATGDASQPITVPNNPTFAGLHFYGQWLIMGTQGAATQAIDLNIEG